MVEVERGTSILRSIYEMSSKADIYNVEVQRKLNYSETVAKNWRIWNFVTSDSDSDE